VLRRKLSAASHRRNAKLGQNFRLPCKVILILFTKRERVCALKFAVKTATQIHQSFLDFYKSMKQLLVLFSSPLPELAEFLAQRMALWLNSCLPINLMLSL
jgi:hypothetical protein